MVSLLAWVLLSLLPARQGTDPDLHTLLQEAVRLPTPERRAERAAELARMDVSVDAWLEVMRGFHRHAPSTAGLRLEEVELSIGGSPATREIAVWVPETYDPTEPAPLLLALHGTGGSGRNQHNAWKDVAEELGMLILAPSEPGANAGYDFGGAELEATLAALRWARLSFNVDENRVLATGISRGGHLCWDLALRHPTELAAAAPMIGGPRIQLARGENNLRYLENVAHLPIRDLQGAKDDPGLVFNLRLAFEKLAKLKAPDAELIEFADLGHSFDRRAVDWVEFLGTARRDPTPPRVVRTFARPGEGRAFWVEVLAADEEVKDDFVPQVRASSWNRKDRFEQLAWLQGAAEEATGRLEVERTPKGRIQARGEGITAFRLLLTDEMLPARGDVIVSWNRRTVRQRPERSSAVLLAEFVERFDRTFLPVVEIRID